MVSVNDRKQLNKYNDLSIKSSIISQIPPNDNLAKITASFEEIVQPPPYDNKSPKSKRTPSSSSSISSTITSTPESDPATKITRTTTTTTVTTVTTTTISAKNSPAQGPLYLDFGDFSISPIEPDKLGSSGEDVKNKHLSSTSQKKPLVSLDNNISVNDPSSIKISSSITSTDPMKIQQVEELSPTSTSSSNTLSSDSQRSFPPPRLGLKGYQKSHLENSEPSSPRRQHCLKRIESAPVMPNLSNDAYDSNMLLSTKSMYNLNHSDQKNTVPLENKLSTETPKQYLERMQFTLSKSKLPSMLAKKSDSFHQAVLKEYMNAFDFEKDPIDIALRKFLMECHLPKETQQIDRVMEAFAKRYHESNPDLFASSDTPYVLAFSLLMLHTDAFNKSVKRKMTKEEFVKNTRIDGVPSEILEILYDNIIFAQFIYADDDIDVNGQTILESPADHKQLRIFSSSKERRRSMRIKNDPYTVIQTKIPTEFKPAIGHLIPIENPYIYMGTLPSLDTANLHRAFASAPSVRVTGVQTRRNGETLSPTNTSIQPLDEVDGTFVLKITKGGKLGRKVDMIEGRRRSGFIRSWRQYGVILSGSQLMFFKDEVWFNTQMAEINDSKKSKKPPTLRPDVILMTTDSVAVYDKTYTKYPHVFRLVCPKGHQYLFQAESEDEMNDWITKINYAATFKTIGLKIRNINVRSRWEKKNPQNLLFNNKLGDHNSNEANGRANVLRSKLDELQCKISALTSKLQLDVRFRNSLFLMIPYKNTTRDRIIQVAHVVAQKLRHTCLELSRLVCYHEILEKELCATVMDDDNYWQNRRSMYRLGENSTELEPFSKDIVETTLRFTEEPETDNDKKEKHTTMTLLPMSSTSSLSTMPCLTPSSSITDSTPPRSPDNERTFSISQTEVELEIKPSDEDNGSIFRDDSSSVISLDFEDAQENFGFDSETNEKEHEKLQTNVPTVVINHEYDEEEDDDDVFVDAEDWY